MKLVIFPGGGDPMTAYNNVYSLLKNEAFRRGFSDTILQLYLGHVSYGLSSVFTLKSGVDTIRKTMKRMEESGEDYIVFCRSLSCDPFM